MFRVCGHCDKTLGAKAYKEHRRHYFHDGRWMRAEFVTTYKEDSPVSTDSSAIILSDPPSDASGELSSDQDEFENERESVISSETSNSGLFCFEDDMMSAGSSASRQEIGKDVLRYNYTRLKP